MGLKKVHVIYEILSLRACSVGSFSCLNQEMKFFVFSVGYTELLLFMTRLVSVICGSYMCSNSYVKESSPAAIYSRYPILSTI